MRLHHEQLFLTIKFHAAADLEMHLAHCRMPLLHDAGEAALNLEEVNQIETVFVEKLEIAIVVGGGNIFRGITLEQ